MKHTILLPILLLNAATATELRAQGGTQPCGNNNLKQLTLATLATEKSSELSVCAGSNGLFVFVDGAGPFAAQAQGCRASVAEVGLGENPQVSSQRRSDGRLAIRVASSQESGCWVVALLPYIEQDALPTATGPGPGSPWIVSVGDAAISGRAGRASSQGGGGIFSSGSGTLTIVGVTDPATRQLLRGRKQGPGRMTILVLRDSELAAQLQSSAGSNRRIAKAEFQFDNALIAELGIPASAAVATVVLENIQVVKIMDRTSPASDESMHITLNFEKLTWPPRR